MQEDNIINILEAGYLMSLATVDESGPWVSDVTYVNDGLTIYWTSGVTTRHSQAIEKNSRVAATVTLTARPGDPDQGLQIEGTAEKVPGDLPEMAEKHHQKRQKMTPFKRGVSLDASRSWYKLTPSKIEIIDEPRLGFKKESVSLPF